MQDGLKRLTFGTLARGLFGRPAHALRLGPSAYLATALAGALVGSCAQLERAPDPDTERTQPISVPTIQPPPAPRVQPSAPPPSAGDVSSRRERGLVSLYDQEFSGKKTASGERFDPAELTMAHRTLPFGTRVRVTNLENQRSVVVVVNDRGPFVAGRIADLSKAAARRIDMVEDGVVEAVLDVVEPAKKR